MAGKSGYGVVWCVLFRWGRAGEVYYGAVRSVVLRYSKFW